MIRTLLRWTAALVILSVASVPADATGRAEAGLVADADLASTPLDDSETTEAPTTDAPTESPATEPEPDDTTTDTTDAFTVVGADPDLDGGDVALIAIAGAIALLGIAAWWMSRRPDPDDPSRPMTTDDPTGSELL